MSRLFFHLVRVAVSPACRLAAVVAQEFREHYEIEAQVRGAWYQGLTDAQRERFRDRLLVSRPGTAGPDADRP